MMMTRFLAGLSAVLLLVCALPSMAQERGAIAVRVVDSDGDPIGGASVFVWTAHPRSGPAILCPSCYLDCGKQGETDRLGDVTIGDVDPALLFDLMIAAEGFVPRETGLKDPTEGPILVTLERRPILIAEDGHVVYGRAVDVDGRPVPRAVVSVRMYLFPRDEQEGRVSGSSHIEGADRLAVTNDDGVFSIYSP